MRLLILNWKDPAQADAGGAEQYVRRVSEIWAQQAHDVTMVVPRWRDAPIRETLAGVHYIRLGSRLTVFHLGRRYLNRRRDTWDMVLESVSTRPFFAHRVVGRRAVALYHQVADDVWAREFSTPFAWLGRHVVEPAWLRRMHNAQVIAVSPSTRLDLERRGVTVSSCIAPGTDMARRQRSAPPGGGRFRLLFIGRLCNSKRPVEALQAFEMIRETFPDATLDVVGDGYLAPSLRALASSGVSIHGYVDEATKTRLLDNADLLLVPATREGFGIVAVEAAARGLPAVAYDVPGLRDAVIDDVTGVLVRPTARALADGAIALLRDPNRWMRLSDAAYHSGADASWTEVARRLLSAMESFQPTPVAHRGSGVDGAYAQT